MVILHNAFRLERQIAARLNAKTEFFHITVPLIDAGQCFVLLIHLLADHRRHERVGRVADRLSRIQSAVSVVQGVADSDFTAFAAEVERTIIRIGRISRE
ncbi:hypothetical protein D3C84_1046160 [compost metagenome]